MKLVRANQTQEFKNSGSCTAFEYPLGDKDINGAVIKLDGRYPETGYAMNKICKELVYVVEGRGTLTVGDATPTQLAKGDAALLLPNEKYYFEGQLTMFMSCHPAWYPEQHEHID